MLEVQVSEHKLINQNKMLCYLDVAAECVRMRQLFRLSVCVSVRVMMHSTAVDSSGRHSTHRQHLRSLCSKQ